MNLFSERYGYVSPTDALMYEKMPIEVVNALCTEFDALERCLNEKEQDYERRYRQNLTYTQLEEFVWTKYLNRFNRDMYSGRHKKSEVIIPYMRDDNISWYKKLDMVEVVIATVRAFADSVDSVYHDSLKLFIGLVNDDFKRLFYGYRILDDLVTPITDEMEIEEIQKAIEKDTDNVHMHISKALEHYSKRPEPDYRNSIKESISAVECLCRTITGESTLDNAIPKLKNRGVKMNAQFENGLKSLYYYTNDKRTGIRHALMDESYFPTEADAHYMLIICSAFVNYIRSTLASVN